jgi:hypothetical protein
VPKPSPTLMYVKKKNMATKQILGYKTVLFLSLYGLNFFKISLYLKQWKRSVYWAESFGVNKENRL